jgi:plasmid maintenance system killer protein
MCYSDCCGINEQVVMILSYLSEIGKDLFQGNWSTFSGEQALEPLEDCFIDLRILDAAATTQDLELAFRGRIDRIRKGSNDAYSIRQPSTSAFMYRINFVWSGGNAEAVDVRLSSPEDAPRGYDEDSQPRDKAAPRT